jgi:CRP-like cAMP-binding protein
VIERGRVAIRVSTALGDVVTLTVLGPGESFGEQALLDESATRTASAVAVEPVEVRTLHRQHFDELRRKHASVDRLLVELLAAQVRRLTAQLLEALYLPVDRRMMRRLADLAVLYGTSGEIDIPLRQDDLASMAGTTRPTANRILRKLQDSGVISLRKGHVQILDVESLAARAG